MKRAVFLGASNVVRTLSVAVETARQLLGEDLEILAAVGRGRSYGLESSLLFRALPPIRECGLWTALHESKGDVYAVVSDIGNDIGYGVQPATLVAWVRDCVERLAEHGARVVVVPPPRRSIHRRPDWQINMARRILFPSAAPDLTAAVAKARVQELDERLREMLADYDVTVVEQEDDWYGLVDPIHVRLGRWRASWASILGPWNGNDSVLPPQSPQGDDAPRVRPSFGRWRRLAVALPERWKLFGRELGGRDAQVGGVRVRVF